MPTSAQLLSFDIQPGTIMKMRLAQEMFPTYCVAVARKDKNLEIAHIFGGSFLGYNPFLNLRTIDPFDKDHLCSFCPYIPEEPLGRENQKLILFISSVIVAATNNSSFLFQHVPIR